MSDWRHVWAFEIKPPFKKQYRGLDAITRKKVDDAVRDLQGSGNPAPLGRYKQGMRIFSHDVFRPCSKTISLFPPSLMYGDRPPYAMQV